MSLNIKEYSAKVLLINDGTIKFYINCGVVYEIIHENNNKLLVYSDCSVAIIDSESGHILSIVADVGGLSDILKNYLQTFKYQELDSKYDWNFQNLGRIWGGSGEKLSIKELKNKVEISMQNLGFSNPIEHIFVIQLIDDQK